MRWSILLLIFVFSVSANQVSCCGQAPKTDPDQKKSADPPTQPAIGQLIAAAQSNFQQGNYAKAEELANAVIVRQPNNARIHRLTADIRFIAGNIPGAIESYDKVIELEPESKPYLWQRGLALYYAGNFKEGKSQFESHQTVNSQDVENAVWHLLCAANVDNLEDARKKLIPIERDSRVPMKEIYELFAGRLSPEQVIQGATAETKNELPLYYAHLYIGLYHEMLGEQDSAAQSIGLAVKKSSDTKNNLMLQLARVHQELRAASAKTAPAPNKKWKSEGGS